MFLPCVRGEHYRQQGIRQEAMAIAAMEASAGEKISSVTLIAFKQRGRQGIFLDNVGWAGHSGMMNYYDFILNERKTLPFNK